MPDAGDYWFYAFAKHIQGDIGVQCTAGDMAFFFNNFHGRRLGLAATYVKETFCEGTPTFIVTTDKTFERFESRDHKPDDFTFARIEAQALPDAITLHQRKQIEKFIALLSMRQVNTDVTEMRVPDMSGIPIPVTSVLHMYMCGRLHALRYVVGCRLPKSHRHSLTCPM